MDEDRLPFYVIGEDEVHRALGMALVDAVIRHLAHERDADWLEPELVRRWSALAEPVDLPEHRRRGDSHRRGHIRQHGYLAGQPCAPGAHKLRALLVEHARAERTPALLVLLQDTDGDPALGKGVRQVQDWAAARDDLPPVAIGCAHREAEAWFMATPGLAAKQPQRLQQARAALGFDPTRQPERLSAQPNDALTDAKRVLRFVLLAEGERLAAGVPDSVSPSLEEVDELAAQLAADLGHLAQFKACGLAPFVAALKAALPRALHQHLPPAA